MRSIIFVSPQENVSIVWTDATGFIRRERVRAWGILNLTPSRVKPSPLTAEDVRDIAAEQLEKTVARTLTDAGIAYDLVWTHA